MANYLRSLMQTAISQDVLEQAVNLVTNDNLDLGCAVIEKAATEKVYFSSFGFSDQFQSFRKTRYQCNNSGLGMNF